MTVTNQELVDQARDLRLKTLLAYLATDPANESLKVEAVEHALSTKEPIIAARILGSDLSALDDQQLNLAGLAQMQLGRFNQAVECFEQLVARGIVDPSLTFNLAWSLAMEKNFDRALELLSDEVAEAQPQAAMLKVQLLHDREDYEGALQSARHLIELHPDHPGLNAAMSVLAIDVEDAELARRSALKAGNHPDAQASLGTLALADQHIETAIEHFNEALDANQGIARAWIGRGLAKLLKKDLAGATADLDRGAGLFGEHSGSWIAAGWAQLMAGNLDQGRERFERALSADAEDAESHGSLAVVDALEGRNEEAEQRAEIALKLDPECISARLVGALASASQGDPAAARKLLEKLLDTPTNERGETVAEALARLGLS